MLKRALIIGGSILAVTVLLWLWPLPGVITGKGMPESTKILDRNGTLLYEVQGQGFHSNIPYESIPKALIDGLIATEDRTFMTNPGVSLRGIVRAAWHDLLARRVVEGGSTITQQLVRTLLQPKNRGFTYKIHEAWLAVKYDMTYSKHDILERYLNTSYFGQGAYGIKAAAKTYFDSDIVTLSTGQSALLIGLLNAPTALNPFKEPDAAKARRDLVLKAMLHEHVIDQNDFDAAVTEPVVLTSGKTDIKAPHFVLWLLSQHPEFRSHAEIRTTLDLDLQKAAEQIVSRQMKALKDKNVTSAAVVVLDVKTGEILAMVGSSDYFDNDHDGAVNVAVAPRQPGSALKPFTYALAFSQGMTAASVVSDVETQFFTQDGNPYIPRNYDYGYHGPVRLREALANSYNIAAVKVLEHVGVDRLLRFLQSAGFTTLTDSPEHYGLALTLGDSEVKLLELTAAYGIFVNGGTTMKPVSYTDEPKTPGTNILDLKVAWLVTDILSDANARAAEFGQDGPLNFAYPVAAKTGTTRNSRDNWTIGFTPDRIVGVWVGNADNSPMHGTSGITGAGPIFHDVMDEAQKYLGKKWFVRPDGIVDKTICRLSGKLPNGVCTDLVSEHFIAGTEPHDVDDMYVRVLIDSRNGLKASVSCPMSVVVQKVFTVFPPDTQKWARDNGWIAPPDAFSPLCPPVSGTGSVSTRAIESGIVITRPGADASFLLDPLIPDEDEQIVMEARADESVKKLDWYLNGTKIGEGTTPDFRFKWKPVPGSYTLEAVADTQKDTVRFEVRK